MTKHKITIEIDEGELARYTDQRLAGAWHVAQANPVPIDDPHAGKLAERVGREIIRRWLRDVSPELWQHQGHHYYWSCLCEIARFEPGGLAGSPEWWDGRWVPRADGEGAHPLPEPGARE